MAEPTIDEPRLRAWWHSAIGGAAAPLRITPFRGGFSNLTYRIDDGDARFVLRTPPPGVGAGPAHDVVREHRILAAVHPVFDRTPRPIAVETSPEILGVPFFVMEFVEGRILRGTRDEPPLTPDVLAATSRAAIETLAALHRIDVQGTGLDALGKGAGYAQRQIEGWLARYAKAQTHTHEALDRVRAWLAVNIPADEPAALLHNDFKFDNLVVAPDDPTQVRAVLDWEMATVGSPSFDLGTTLGYWLEPTDPAPLRALGIGLTARPGAPTRQELFDQYRAAMRSPEQPGVVPVSPVSPVVPSPSALLSFVFGCLKVSVIAQQLYARYAAGLTADQRFASLHHAVAALGELAERAIRAERISGLAA
ncbi:MAG: phosphotransferase family protein [Gemmatimonadaceae bacterium]|nr:phosphotransferase family protein [Gemmatimonadaceae bacterium]